MSQLTDHLAGLIPALDFTSFLVGYAVATAAFLFTLWIPYRFARREDDRRCLRRAILAALAGREADGRTGREVRKLVDPKSSWGLAGFYFIMKGLEDDGLVEGWYQQTLIDEQVVRERAYQITPRGREELGEGEDAATEES